MALDDASTTMSGTIGYTQKQDALLHHEERYRTFAEVTGQLAWVTNADGEVEEDLPFWRRYTGQSHEESMGRGWLKCIHPDDAEPVMRAWTKAVITKTAYKTEYRVRRHDGVYRHFLALAVPLLSADGSVREWVGTCIDITERKQAEEEIAGRAAELEAIFAAQNDAVLLYDTDMNVRRVNPSFLVIYGFDPVGVHVKEIAQRVSCRRLDGRPLVWEEQPTPRALRGERVTGARFLVARADGTEMTVEASSGPMLVGEHIVGSVTVWHDITEQQQAEKSLLQVRVQLEERLQEMAETIRKVLGGPIRKTADSDVRFLTTREIEVLTLIAEGRSSKAIADRLFISIHTVNRHRANIMGKLNTRKTVDLVKYAISHGLL